MLFRLLFTASGLIISIFAAPMQISSPTQASTSSKGSTQSSQYSLLHQWNAARAGSAVSNSPSPSRPSPSREVVHHVPSTLHPDPIQEAKALMKAASLSNQKSRSHQRKAKTYSVRGNVKGKKASKLQVVIPGKQKDNQITTSHDESTLHRSASQEWNDHDLSKLLDFPPSPTPDTSSSHSIVTGSPKIAASGHQSTEKEAPRPSHILAASDLASIKRAKKGHLPRALMDPETLTRTRENARIATAKRRAMLTWRKKTEAALGLEPITPGPYKSKTKRPRSRADLPPEKLKEVREKDKLKKRIKKAESRKEVQIGWTEGDQDK
jgi:hypothetical protein